MEKSKKQAAPVLKQGFGGSTDVQRLHGTTELCCVIALTVSSFRKLVQATNNQNRTEKVQEGRREAGFGSEAGAAAGPGLRSPVAENHAGHLWQSLTHKARETVARGAGKDDHVQHRRPETTL